MTRPRRKHEQRPISRSVREAVEADVAYLIANPRHGPRAPARYPETEAMEQVGNTVNEMLRRLACKYAKGPDGKPLTLEQLEEEIDNVRLAAQPFYDLSTGYTARRARMKQALVPDRYIQAVGDKEPTDCEALQRVRIFMRSPLNVLVLAGGRGNFKTGSACTMLGAAERGQFVHVDELLAVSIDDKARWAKLLEAPAVVFDDLGDETQDSKGLFVSAFQKLFKAAYSKAHKLVVTVNLTAKQFFADPEDGGYMNARLRDRFEECGEWFDVVGASRRREMRPQVHWQERAEREPGSDDE